MALKTTRWTPDTCGCVLEFNWDDAIPEALRIHTFARSLRVCAAHEAVRDRDTHFAAISAENRTKNAAINTLASNHPAAVAAASWSWDENRRLVLVAPALTALQKSNLEASIGALGVGSVSVR